MMEIEKGKRIGTKCRLCLKPISFKYRVVYGYRNPIYYHLSCYYSYLKREIERVKSNIKKFSKGKYKRQMILEGLEK